MAAAMMMKGKQRIAVETSPPGASFYPIAAGARAQFRYRSLLMDYQELLEETEAKKRHLQKEQRKKLKLLAEVKFLRKKYEGFLKNPSGSTSYRVKKRPRTVLPHSTHNSQPSELIIQSGVPLKDNIHFRSEAFTLSTSVGIDLNQVSLPNDNEMEEFQVNWEPLEVGNSRKHPFEGNALSSDLKFPIFQEGKGSSVIKKKKIAWHDQVAFKFQDQVALKV